MIQRIKLLSLPLPELKEQIQLEVDANPALELIEDRSTESLERLRDGVDQDQGPDPDMLFDNASDSGFTRATGTDDTKRAFIEGAISRHETLQEHLLWQLALQPIPDLWRAIGEVLIQNLDGDGFHKEDPYLSCKDADPELVRKVMGLIRSFEPTGTCASNYRESLIIQAELDPDAPPEAVVILREKMDLLEHGKHAEIQKALKLTDTQMQAALAYVRTLTPFPGRQLYGEETQYVLPDVVVTRKEGEFVIRLNDEEIPILGINPFFDRLSGERHDKSTDSFVRDNIRQARWFIDGIHQRNNTLLKVVRSIVEFQRAFFANGPKHIAPLTLRDIAREIDVHETTVSRIANRKYMQTDWGIYEIRHFFTNSISGAGSSGSRFSKEGVKQMIKEIIENEASALSDKDIAEALSRKGVNLARRTVAKYRGELNMDSSFGRKRD
jgi:RNA polymerase sigma-54 factor